MALAALLYNFCTTIADSGDFVDLNAASIVRFEISRQMIPNHLHSLMLARCCKYLHCMNIQ